jgi:integrase
MRCCSLLTASGRAASAPARALAQSAEQRGLYGGGSASPWTRDGFGSSFNKAKIAAGMSDGDLHFDDLRGTAATRFYVAGLPERVIAEIMGWEEEHVARIIRHYVDRTAATKAIIRQLNEKRT